MSPDIMLLMLTDEVVTLGDELLKRKACASMREKIAPEQTAVFATRSAAEIVRLCDRTILLENAEILSDGRYREIIEQYRRLLTENR